MGDTAATIRSFLYGMYELGITDVREEMLLNVSGYARTDSKGYRNAMKYLIKELKHCIKSGKIVRLTEQGIQYEAPNGAAAAATRPTSNREYQEQQMKKILKFVKAPKRKVIAVFEMLADGDYHAEGELLAATEYKRTDSKGYAEIKKWMKLLGLLENDGQSYRFSGKAFPFPRDDA